MNKFEPHSHETQSTTIQTNNDPHYKISHSEEEHLTKNDKTS